MMRRFVPAAALVLAIMPRNALAGDAALAETLFQQGLELMDKGDFAAACPKLEESYAQDAATGTLLALALCQERSGLTASAWATYSEVLARAKRDGRQDREQSAREKIQALEPLLSRLTIEVDASTAAAQGLVVKRDGVSIGRAAWGAPSPIDPGDHVVDASAPGKRAWRTTVTIAATADSRIVQVPPLVDEPVKPVPTTETVAVPQRAHSGETAGSTDAGSRSEGVPLRTIGLVVGGVGIVGLGVSAYFGVRAKNLYSDSNSGAGACSENDKCPPDALSKRSSAVDAANAATIALVAGGVLTATGVTLFLVGGSREAKPDAARIEATPAVGPSTAAMVIRGRF